MLVMTYSEARANLSSFLNQVLKDGSAIIKRADGNSFKVTVDNEEKKSPFENVTPVLGNLSKEEILDSIHEGRKR